MTVVEERPAPAAAPPPGRPGRVRALLRNSWRQLTSMRTALVLLLLLAVAAIPGSVLPQRGVARESVTDFYAAHPDLAPWVERLGGFEVFASPWFAAIYLLLFASLVGCVVPRLAEHVRALRTVPPEAPKRLDRLPQHAPPEPSAADAATTAANIARTLRGRRFRTVVREQPDASWTVAAEKGFLKETGNLIFHFALLAVLVGVGFGSWYGWNGNRLLVQGADTKFCNALTQYDESALGPRVQPRDLPFFCLELTRFVATYQTTGQPKSFNATVTVDDGAAARTADFSVNSPLRLDRANVYLLGQGYAPVLRYTDRYGQQQTNVFPFLPVDGMLTSEGVAIFPDANVDPRTGARDTTAQVAFEGAYLPTVDPSGEQVTSLFPEERAPKIFLTAYRGNLGLDSGIPTSVYSLNRAQITRGQLKNVSGTRPEALRPGDVWTLDDGTKLEFLGTRPFITVSVRYDPTQPVVLAGAVLGLLGLMLSLAGKRRRIWFRVTPGPADLARAAAAPANLVGAPAAPADLVGAAAAPGGSVVQAGGLPRTDYPGFGDEFAEIVTATRGNAGDAVSPDGDHTAARDGDERPERTA